MRHCSDKLRIFLLAGPGRTAQTRSEIKMAAMAGVKYKVLLSRQKTQKNKRWVEGFLIEGEHGMQSLPLRCLTHFSIYPSIEFKT
jgi:hypothetical protein